MTEGNRFVWGENPPWQIERVLIPGERYLVACFPEKEHAVECLKTIENSLEVKTGAEVRYA